jgi:cysteinyl-tRNA synthetase
LGRPGWHIECSAMAEKHLGVSFDIHGGGIDLVFPHHENEIAQSEACHNSPMAKYWMHNGHLSVDGQKMSKSLGNVVIVQDMMGKFSGQVVRWALLSSHYRQPLDWNSSLLIQSKAALDRVYGALETYPELWSEEFNFEYVDAECFASLCDDLNTPLFFAGIHQLVHAVHTLDEKKAMQKTLFHTLRLVGFLKPTIEDWFHEPSNESKITVSEVEALLQQRLDAKLNKNFQKADAIRELLLKSKVVVQDGPQGQKWRRQ